MFSFVSLFFSSISAFSLHPLFQTFFPQLKDWHLFLSFFIYISICSFHLSLVLSILENILLLPFDFFLICYY
ncbi:hypothetical protein C1645_760896 [Glomus cerebriforme]|uniref:Uncharacterized protein n=1 Tax=Glomus cerebriforme TaxID=658196 RepID=A0A397T718_9GLOM|nr:hypothetical protein C1645_760896 [Glomus cerebriforme]